jgi:acetylornithine deacetylase/succinyl-diaminopimelate desuccinylase-like protein
MARSDCITAIACVADLNRRGRRLPFAVEVVGFADEEGVRFASTLLGSRAVAGTLSESALNARDRDGVSMRDAMVQFGLDPEHIGAAARDPPRTACLCRTAHRAGAGAGTAKPAVGVVTAIAGATRLAAKLTGMAGHAGTVPMAMRRDALRAPPNASHGGGILQDRRGGLVGTVGYIDAKPGATNVIPGWCPSRSTSARHQIRTARWRRRHRAADRSDRQTPRTGAAARRHPRKPHRALRALAEAQVAEAVGGRGLWRVRTAERAGMTAWR